MRPDGEAIFLVFLLVAFGGPLALGLAGLVGRGGAADGPRPKVRWDWRLTAASTVLYVLAFNLVFFVQELFLVIPKALVPALEPVLYHNNHGWAGDDPIARLLQGTGALAILLVGLGAIVLLRMYRFRSPTLRLFVVWIAYQGLFQSIPQVVAGAILPQNDVGMAMDYLDLSPLAMLLAASAATIAMACAGIWLASPLLELAAGRADVSDRSGRTLSVFQIATVPALAAILLILPFRVPGSLDQVLIVPVAVTLLGTTWIQASAWRVARQPYPGLVGNFAIAAPLLTALVMLAAFQILLRPGVDF